MQVYLVYFLDGFVNDYELSLITLNFSRMKKLNELVLSGNQITSTGIEFLTNNLKSITQLETIDLQSNSIDDEGMMLLCKNLRLIPNLTCLEVGSIIN